MFRKSNAGDQLLLAVKLNKVTEISRLVALGVNVNSRIDKNGKTVLHYAAYKGLLASVKALIEAGADLDITDENGVTALHRGAIDGHADVVRALLDGGGSVDKKDENGNTPLHEAAWNGYSKCVTLLVNSNCNVNLHNRTGYTSLHLAAQNCHCKSLEVLLKGGANPLAKNNYGDSPLHIVARYGHKDACKILLGSSEINICDQNNDGNTPLHIATGMGHEKLADMLLKAGCSVATRNNIGDTARDIAIQNGFKKISKLLAPSSGESWKIFRKGKKERPRSVEVSSMYVESLDSTQATTATQLWVPKPVSLDHDPKKLLPKREAPSHFERRGKKKDEEKLQYRVLTIKPNEMCSIEREYSAFLKKRKLALRRSCKSDKSHSRSTLKSQEEKRRSDPGFYVVESKSSHSRARENKNRLARSAQSRDDLEIALAPKKSKKDKGVFAIFRSSSDPDLTSEMKNGTAFGKKHKDKFHPSKQLMGNGVHHRIPEEVFNEKGEIEETKEKRRERKEREKGGHRTEKRDKSSKRERGNEKDKYEKKERKIEKEKEREKDKEKRHARRDEKEGSEADCSVCQEKIRKSREKSHPRESRHKDKEHSRSKSESKRVKDYDNPDMKYSDQRSTDEDKEYKRKKHRHELEKEKDKSKKDKHHGRHHEKHHEKHHDKHHKRRNEEVDLGSIPCNPDHCSTCKASLRRLEAWQERCTTEIESARRRLEHRLQRLEKKLEHQQSDERQSKDKESRDKEYDRVNDECRAVRKNVKDSTGDVKEEIRGVIKGGLSKLELRLGQISTGYNIPFLDVKDRCNPELGRNCSASRRAVRSRSSPHLGRAPCADCASAMDHRMGISPLNTPLSVSHTLTSGTDSLLSSRVSSHALTSDTGSMETVIEARPVSEEEVLKVPETILEARPVVEEGVYDAKDTYAAAQVQHQRQVQEVERWWQAKAEEEQRVLYARICELEQMLMMTRVGGGGDSGCIV